MTLNMNGFFNVGLHVVFTLYLQKANIKILGCQIQDVSTSISIVHDLIEMSPGDERNKHI